MNMNEQILTTFWTVVVTCYSMVIQATKGGLVLTLFTVQYLHLGTAYHVCAFVTMYVHLYICVDYVYHICDLNFSEIK